MSLHYIDYQFSLNLNVLGRRNMKILMLKAYYEPEQYASSYLTNNMIEDYILAGHAVELLAPTPTRGVTDEIRKHYVKEPNEVHYEGKLKVSRFYAPRESKNIVLRVLRYVYINFMYILKAISLKDIDIAMIGSTPPTMGVVGAIIKKTKKIPFIYSVQDVFPDSLVHSNLTKENSLVWKFGRTLENLMYKAANKIIVISEDFRQNLIIKGVPAEKIEVIYNWVDENQVVHIDRDRNVLFDQFNLDRSLFYVVYAGNLGHAQNIEVILKTAKQLNDFKDIRFVIFGGGQQEGHYKQIAEEMKLENVGFYPLQPYSLVSNVYSLGDVSLVTCKKGLGKSAMPSKAWSILSSETPIIANFDKGTDLERIIVDNRLGKFTDSNDVEGLKNAIVEMHSNLSIAKDMGRRGRQFVLENLTRTVGTKQYIDQMTKLAR